jgi:hypothetical protein
LDFTLAEEEAMRTLVKLTVVGFFGFVLAVAPTEAEAQCWTCSGNDCVETGGIGGDAGCTGTYVCMEGYGCSFSCAPGGGLCGIEAVPLTGQMVVPAHVADPEASASLAANGELWVQTCGSMARAVIWRPDAQPLVPLSEVRAARVS